MAHLTITRESRGCWSCQQVCRHLRTQPVSAALHTGCCEDPDCKTLLIPTQAGTGPRSQMQLQAHTLTEQSLYTGRHAALQYIMSGQHDVVHEH